MAPLQEVRSVQGIDEVSGAARNGDRYVHRSGLMRFVPLRILRY